MAPRSVRIRSRSSVLRVVAVAVAVAALPALAHACSVPVFRYALDHWLPDPFQIQILHDGALSDDEASLVETLKTRAETQFSNAVIETVDIRAVDDPELTARYRQPNGADTPWCVVRGPTGRPDDFRDVWSGPFNQDAVEALLGSPVRDELIQRLLGGASVVWIYLEAGDAAVDAGNYRLIETELARLAGELELPEIEEVDLKELSTSPEDITLSFSSVRLSRTDPHEQLLVEMLLSSEPDLRDQMFVGEPMAFPVFGRGRVLYSLVGDGITAGLIEDACRFLTGACQCTVKAQNPGVDLLLSVDWDGLISPTQPADVEVTLTGLAGFQSDSGNRSPPVATANATVPEETVPDPEPARAASRQPQSNILAVVDSSAGEPVPGLATPPATAPLERRQEAAASPLIRPGLVIAALALLVVVGSFFLIPRR